jgi:hypothetical protein
MSKKKLTGVCLAMMLGLASIAGAAAPNPRDILRDNQKMRQNITWLVAGLAELGKSAQPNLRLTPEEARKILPIFEELITRRIIILNISDFPKNQEQRPSNPQPSSGTPSQPSAQSRPQNNTTGGGERMAKLALETTFGNAQTDRVDALLTKKQVVFIDNLNFDPLKYGYLDFTRGRSANGTSGNQMSASQAPVDPRQQLEKGRLEQVKLNNQVYRILKQMK